MDWLDKPVELGNNISGMLIPLLTFFAEGMEQRQSGQIIVLSSVAGERGRQSNFIYGSAKAGMKILIYAPHVQGRLPACPAAAWTFAGRGLARDGGRRGLRRGLAGGAALPNLTESTSESPAGSTSRKIRKFIVLE